ncbi:MULTISPECIES: indole-3-glycerol phosphate synthase TrpC [unclassified Corynebacterium]|uniref:indole-3-glycerol phosphate synthase TrpC n=1 Tax=unclassified Corynebacterium TaxID=2624378 RepID=UPI00124EC9F4|nr:MULTISPECIES: indole-3-glycerol phosphate synthase TrpC [unclassified Corynebacterium]
MVSEIERILAGVSEDVKAREHRLPFKEIKRLSFSAPKPRDARAALSQPGCSIIAELKRAVPNKGELAAIEHPALLAQLFEREGARIISCQTERRRFNGDLRDVRAVKQAVDVPVMAKDFIIDPYQIHEARYFGADVVPLIAAILDQHRLEALLDRIESLGMTALVEVNTREEASRAVQAGATLIGVNARSMETFELNPTAFSEIAPGLPSGVVRIAMSGVDTPQQLMTYAGWGADAVIISTSLVTHEDPAGLCRKLVAAGQHPACPSTR